MTEQLPADNLSIASLNPKQTIPLQTPQESHKQAIIILGILSALIGITILAFGARSYLDKQSNFSVQIPAPSPTTITESSSKVIGTIPPDASIHDCVFASTGESYACIRDYYDSSEASVIFNGQESERFTSIRYLQFSPDGNRLAYLAQKDKVVFVVLDGQKGNEYESISNVIFSNDSKRIAYIVGEKLDDRGEFDGSYDPVPLNSFVVLDDEEGPKFSGSLAGLHFTYDNSSLFFNSDFDPNSDFQERILYKNGLEVFRTPTSFLSGPVMDSSKENIAYIFKKGESLKTVIIFDKTGEKILEKPLPNPDGFIYSVNSDASIFLYMVHQEDGSGDYKLYLNTSELLRADGFWNPKLSPDGEKYIADAIGYIDGKVEIGGTSPIATVIFDGNKLTSFTTFYNRISDFVFSEDNKYVSYLVSSASMDSTNQVTFVLSDGQHLCEKVFSGFMWESKYLFDGYSENKFLQGPIFDDKTSTVSFGYYNRNQLIWHTEPVDMGNCDTITAKE